MVYLGLLLLLVLSCWISFLSSQALWLLVHGNLKIKPPSWFGERPHKVPFSLMLIILGSMSVDAAIFCFLPLRNASYMALVGLILGIVIWFLTIGQMLMVLNSLPAPTGTLEAMKRMREEKSPEVKSAVQE